MVRIAVIGLGHVGLANALSLGKQFKITAYDIDENVVRLLNSGKIPFYDDDIEKYISDNELDITYTSHFSEILDSDIEYYIITVPTDFNENSQKLDTTLVEDIVEKLSKKGSHITIIIRSTIPIGFSNKIEKEYDEVDIFFVPEFLREGKALMDSLNPSRIVIGGREASRRKNIANIFYSVLKNKSTPLLLVGNEEAEAIKLFSNAYLSTRVAFFNELDAFAELNKLDSKEIISGICLDSRIGNYYNNPSFGYGGYCLPKDTRQVCNELSFLPDTIVNAVVLSNENRKHYIVKQIINKKPKLVGVYRLSMKVNSDNFKDSSTVDIIRMLLSQKIKVVVYEPLLPDEKYIFNVSRDIKKFLMKCDLIIANRYDSLLDEVSDKVYTRDIWNNN